MNKLHILGFFLLVCFVLTKTTKFEIIDGRRLIQFSENLKLWLTHEQIDELGKNGEVNFMDITDHQEVPQTKVKDTGSIPTALRYQSIVKPIAEKASIPNIKKTIEDMSAFFNRYYTTKTGEEAALYLKKRFEDYIKGLPAARQALFKVSLFKHSFLQPSVIVRFLGQDPTLKNEIVVLGGHLDSTAGGASNRAPGADDDASGSATVLEVFRLLAQSTYVPDRSIDFMLYAAEEVGLRGSADIAGKYRADREAVHAVIQFDMVGYLTRSTVGVITDFTDPALTSFMKKCIEGYSTLKHGDTRCGYACSDHASWTRNNYRAVFPFEAFPFSNINRNIHTANDLISVLNLNDAIEYSKFGVGFAVELSKK